MTRPAGPRAGFGRPGPPVLPGVDVLLAERCELLRGLRVGVVTNHTGTNARLESTVDLLVRHPGLRVTALFAGEHGLRGDVPAGVHVQSAVDADTGLPLHSLYGATRKPTAEMLTDVDALVFDMQDSGARFYTFTWTMAHCLEAAAQLGKRVVVLDRPNPITGERTEGGVVHPGFESFVGLYPVPTRHGLTLGEIAMLLNDRFAIGCDLHVVPVRGWRRSMWWEDTGLPFVPMSPNTDDMNMVLLYPGTCFFEGTNLSEGRGTTSPFQVFGAPWVDERAVIAELRRRDLPGVLFRPTYFTPWYSKYQGEVCRGVQVHVVDRTVLQPVALGAHLLDVCKRVHPDRFAWREAAQDMVRPIDRLSGSDRLARAIDAGLPLEGLLMEWRREAADFAAGATVYHLYE